LILSIYKLIDRLFESQQRDEALSLAEQVSDQIDELAKARDFLMVNHLFSHIDEYLTGMPHREPLLACSLQFPLSAQVLENVVPKLREDQEVFDAVISNLVANRTWRFEPSAMENVIKDLAWADQHEAMISILEGIIQEGNVKGAGLDLIAIATEFTLERKDDVMARWVARNEQKLLALDCEGGITVNSFPGEGIGWYNKGVCEFGLKMASRNVENATGIDLINLERIQGKALDYEKNPTNYVDDWACYLYLTPYPIERYTSEEKTFCHSKLIGVLKDIKDSEWASKLKIERVYDIARADVRHGAGKDPSKLFAQFLQDYREAGYPLPKPWVSSALNEIAIDVHEDMGRFSQILKISKSHRVRINFEPFEASFQRSLSASSRKLPFVAGMGLLAGLRDGYPISPKFFGTWFKYCAEKWDQKQRENFIQAITMEVLQACPNLRDQRMGADLGL